MKISIKNKFVITVPVLLTIILFCSVSFTLALLTAQTQILKNTFVPVDVPISVSENFDGYVKNDVKIRNDGDAPAYIRANVVVNYITYDSRVGTGHYYLNGREQPVVDVDYTIEWLLSANGWVKSSDGYYYYTKPVLGQQTTDSLFTNCKPVAGTEPQGWALNVKVIAQSIQARGIGTDGNGNPIKPVMHAWPSGVSAVNDDGTLVIIQ